MLEILPILSRICNQPTRLCSKIGRVTPSSLLLNNTIIPLVVIPSRSTKVLRRKFSVPLYKEGNNPRFRRSSYFYELVENTDNSPEPLIDVVITSYAEGIGNPGDIITMKRTTAYHRLLLPGLADYATPENLEYSKNLKKDTLLQETQITPSVEFCIKKLNTTLVAVTMNMENEWTIEPWHVRASFRKAGIFVSSDSSIELPPQPIKGPNMDLERKEFFVTVTINKKHKVKVRCCIHHWSTAISGRLPYDENYLAVVGDKLFPEDDTSEKTTAST